MRLSPMSCSGEFSVWRTLHGGRFGRVKFTHHGIYWTPYRKQKPRFISWSELDQLDLPLAEARLARPENYWA